MKYISTIVLHKNTGGQASEAQSSQVDASAAQSFEAQNTEAVDEDAFQHDPVLNELGVEPYVNEEVTIIIGLAQNANVENYDTNLYTQKLEEYFAATFKQMLNMSGDQMVGCFSYLSAMLQLKPYCA